MLGILETPRAGTKRSAILVAVLCLGIACARIATAENASHPDAAEIISTENSVESLAPPAVWWPATVGQKLAWHDRLRTGEDSRAAVRLSDSSILRLDELTEAEVLPPPVASAKPTVDLKQGTAYFFSREKSREINVQTPAANGGIRGTEFVVTVAADGSTSFTMIDGEVELSNPSGSLVVRSGERAEIEPGQKAAKTSVANPIDSAQWCFYYPGVLDPKEVLASIKDPGALQASLSAYREGDLLMALQQYPSDRSPASPEEKAYRAGLLLFAGQVAKAEDLLADIAHDVHDRQALSTLIAAITLKDRQGGESPQTASDWSAESYYLQSKGHLIGALQAANRATALDPDFGFGWTRVAELELSSGRTSQAKTALEKGLSLAPRNPAAHALRGFILSAEGRLSEAKDSFEKAMSLDSALGDAWLGHGLCLIRQGHEKAGRRDILTAAALEPNRAIFRTYLDKDFSDGGSKTTTQKGHVPPSGVTAGPRPYYPGLIPPPGITAGSRPYYLGPISRPGKSASPKPEHSGRPQRARPTATPRPSRPEGPPKTAPGPTPRRPKPTPRPTPSERPGRGHPVRQPKQAQPAQRAGIPAAPATQQPAKGKKKRPTPSQSPAPY
jgi:tetratricopeptide (TPR) repeat protein